LEANMRGTNATRPRHVSKNTVGCLDWRDFREIFFQNPALPEKHGQEISYNFV